MENCIIQWHIGAFFLSWILFCICHFWIKFDFFFEISFQIKNKHQNSQFFPISSKKSIEKSNFKLSQSPYCRIKVCVKCFKIECIRRNVVDCVLKTHNLWYPVWWARPSFHRVVVWVERERDSGWQSSKEHAINKRIVLNRQLPTTSGNKRNKKLNDWKLSVSVPFRSVLFCSARE